MFTKKFWKRTSERAVKTAGQAGALALVAVGTDQVNALTADWLTVLGFALGGAALSVLTSLASLRVGPGDDPSAV